MSVIRLSRGCALILLILLSMGGCAEEILHDLDEQEANRIVVALREHQINAEKRRSGRLWSIQVASSDVGESLRQIEYRKAFRQSTLDSLPTSNSLIPLREEREFLRERQLSRALEETLRSIPGVIDARVHLLLTSAPETRTASLLLLGEPRMERNELLRLFSSASGVDIPRIQIAISEPLQPDMKAPPEHWTENKIRLYSIASLVGAIVLGGGALWIRK